MKKQLLLLGVLGLAQSICAMEQNLDKKLWAAARRGEYDNVKDLLDQGASPDASGTQGISALGAAASGGHVRVIGLLLERHADVNAASNHSVTPLMEAVNHNHYAAVEQLLKAGAQVNNLNWQGDTALNTAARLNKTAIVQLLLEANADIIIPDMWEETPLLWAARNGNMQIVELILTHISREDQQELKNTVYATLSAMKKVKNPIIMKDIRHTIRDELIGKFIERQMARAIEEIQWSNAAGSNAHTQAIASGHHQIANLLDLNNPASVARIRQLIRNNIYRILFGHPQERKQYGKTMPITQEEMAELFGYFGESPEEGNQ